MAGNDVSLANFFIYAGTCFPEGYFSYTMCERIVFVPKATKLVSQRAPRWNDRQIDNNLNGQFVEVVEARLCWPPSKPDVNHMQVVPYIAQGVS